MGYRSSYYYSRYYYMQYSFDGNDFYNYTDFTGNTQVSFDGIYFITNPSSPSGTSVALISWRTHLSVSIAGL